MTPRLFGDSEEEDVFIVICSSACFCKFSIISIIRFKISNSLPLGVDIVSLSIFKSNPTLGSTSGLDFICSNLVLRRANLFSVVALISDVVVVPAFVVVVVVDAVVVVLIVVVVVVVFVVVVVVVVVVIGVTFLWDKYIKVAGTQFKKAKWPK